MSPIGFPEWESLPGTVLGRFAPDMTSPRIRYFSRSPLACCKECGLETVNERLLDAVHNYRSVLGQQLPWALVQGMNLRKTFSSRETIAAER